jgi:thiosulfate dehydrogenase [quinone] large subunit
MKSFSNHQLAYLLARLTLGINFFLHGLVRLPKLPQFVSGMEQQFSESWLPGFLVIPTAYAIPLAEFILGAMLIIGLFTRKVLTASAVLMMVLIAGCCLIENWSAVGTQMVYALYIFFLIIYLEHDTAWKSKPAKP